MCVNVSLILPLPYVAEVLIIENKIINNEFPSFWLVRCQERGEKLQNRKLCDKFMSSHLTFEGVKLKFLDLEFGKFSDLMHEKNLKSIKCLSEEFKLRTGVHIQF